MYRRRIIYRRRRLTFRRKFVARRRRYVRRNYFNRSLTRSVLRKGSTFFTRLHFNLAVSPIAPNRATFGPFLKLSDFSQFTEIAKHWQYVRPWKIVLKFTPLISENILTTNVRQHCIAPYYQDARVSPVSKLIQTYESVMALPTAKHSAGTNPLSLSFIPRIPTQFSQFASHGSAVGVGLQKRPLINCNFGDDASLPNIYGFVYVHSGVNHDGDSKGSLSIVMDAYVYCTFYNYNYQMIGQK